MAAVNLFKEVQITQVFKPSEAKTLGSSRSFCCVGPAAADPRQSGLLRQAGGFCALDTEPVQPFHPLPLLSSSVPLTR